MRVTLDTNVFDPVADLAAYPCCPDPTSCEGIRRAIEDGKILAYVSEASLSLEALGREQRIDEFFREWATKTAGISLPTPDRKRVEIVERILRLGVKVLHVPRVALCAFVPIPEDSWAEGHTFSVEQRQERHSDFVRSFPDKGTRPLRDLGASLVRTHNLDTASVIWYPGWPAPEELIWIRGIVAEFDTPRQFSSRDRFVSHVRSLISEWCDLDVLASHYAYGNDYFCTFDEGRKAGRRAILHRTRWADLEKQFGIKCVTPRQMLDAMGG